MDKTKAIDAISVIQGITLVITNFSIPNYNFSI